MNLNPKVIYLAIPLAFVTLSPAAVIVQWGSGTGTLGTATDIVTVNSSMVSMGSTLNLSTINSPAYNSGGYYKASTYGSFSAAVAAEQTPQFHAAVVASGPDGITAATASVIHQTPDYLRFNGAGGLSSGSRTVSGIVLWTKDYFANGVGSGDTIELTSIGLRAQTNLTGSSAIRFVIRQANTLYISNDIGDLSGTAANFTPALNTLTWFGYDPTSSITTIGSSVTLSNFENITGVGYYLSNTYTGGNPGSQQLSVSSFLVEGTVSAIPEPSSFSAIAGVAALGWVITRRRGRHD